MMNYLLVALGGALGSVARFWLSVWASHRWGDSFPWGTLLVNVSGAFAIGVIAAFTLPESRLQLSPPARYFLMAGLCGGYTTFSAFSLQMFHLLTLGQWLKAAAYASSSVFICLLAVWAGHLLATAINPR